MTAQPSFALCSPEFPGGKMTNITLMSSTPLVWIFSGIAH